MSNPYMLHNKHVKDYSGLTIMLNQNMAVITLICCAQIELAYKGH